MKGTRSAATAFIAICFLWMECEPLPHGPAAMAPLPCCTELQNCEPKESLSPCSGLLSDAVINIVTKYS